MKKSVLGLFIVSVFCLNAFSDIVVAPSDKDLMDLDHYKFYTWNIQIDPNQTFESAVLSFDNIRDWTAEHNQLYVRLLQDQTTLGTKLGNTKLPSGVYDMYQGTDNQTGGDNLKNRPGILLNPTYFSYHQKSGTASWVDIGTSATDIDYTFSALELNYLNTVAAIDGKFAIGLDPDCHFYNDGIKLTLTPKKISVPEPGVLSMIGVSLLGLGLLIRRKRVK